MLRRLLLPLLGEERIAASGWQRGARRMNEGRGLIIKFSSEAVRPHAEGTEANQALSALFFVLFRE